MTEGLKNEKEKQKKSAEESTSEQVNEIEVGANDNDCNEADDVKSQKYDLGEADKEKVSFLELFVANFADVTAISALTFILLFLTELILGFMGYIVKDKIGIYLIIFIFTSIIYAPICAKTKLKATIGQKLFFLEVKKDN